MDTVDRIKTRFGHEHPHKRLGRALILDELFDLTLYRRLVLREKGELKRLLEELIPIEEKHVAFWQRFFGLPISELNFGRRIKLWLTLAARRLFGSRVTNIVLESIEIYAVGNYLSLWNEYKDTLFGSALREILEDELKHEEMAVTSAAARRIDPERVRSVFLGLNDGLVEILGAVSGFFAAFTSVASVLAAALTVAVAGSISMAAGVFVAASSEREIHEIERQKRRFLEGDSADGVALVRPLSSAVLVGIFYFFGALVPIAPVLFGARSLTASVIAGGAMMLLVSFAVSTLSGMAARKRIVFNLVIMAVAVGVTYAIGIGAKTILGISL